MPRITVKGVEIAFDDSQPTEDCRGTVVLLHSSASSRAQWRALTADLRTCYHIIAPDLHGYGETGDWHGRRSLTLADEAEIVAAMIARADGPIHLVGHSYGGAVALRFAFERPDLLRSLALIEPVAFHLLRHRGCSEHPHCSEHDLLSRVRDIAETVAGDSVRGMACFVDFWNGAGAWSQLREKTRTDLARRAGKVALDFQATLEEPVPPAAYRRISVPSRILRGETSPPVAQAIAARLAAVLPEATLDVIPGAGHMLPLTHAAAVNAVIAAHLSDTDESAPLAA